ncbi:MAG: DUF3224 domain-containing protein [Chloroflexota bacterium]|nr:DUF3224 domain-containing protein [Chloroflexota bacterium]
MHAKGTFKIKSWDEKPYNEGEGLPKLTRASVTQSYQGDIEGEGAVEYLMAYRDDKTASFVEMQRVVGSIGGRSGSFVFQGNGTFEGGIARGTWLIVPGSATGGLRGLRGEGSFRAVHGEEQVEVTLNYSFD